ncbi:MAG: hypothetical protein SR1Q5_09515 [Quinella sp. 1Q5]|nr:hypothetical protein [Quinella sp. 1Q5]
MINADEHKKLLAQIKELEQDSVNYFDVEKEFFLIDSDNLATVQTKFYGYSIQQSGIYEDDNLTAEAIANLDGRGCYVYVEVKDEQITIKQDLNGSWGLYLFRHDTYFALSNSFFRLLDHVKFKYSLTVNRDYCHHLLLNDLCSHAYSETAVNEVRLIERNAIIRINIKDKNLKTELIDYRENTIPLDSQEAMTIFDHWIEFWSGVLRSVIQNTRFFTADLSGGFDSRISWVPLLCTETNLNGIKISSIKGTHHTYKDDYEIASNIAAHYGLKLNQSLPKNQSFNLTFSDIWNIDYYSRQTFHKSHNLLISMSQTSVEKTYALNGYGGETIRRYWQGSPKKQIQNQNARTRNYSPALSYELFNSMKTIFESGFGSIRNKYKIKDEDSEDIPQYLYQETRCRHHFGKVTLINYLKGNVQLSPIMDPELRTLLLTTPECSDPNLLMALIFIRYRPELLNFPFDSGHSIAPETIEYAHKINKHFLRHMTTTQVASKQTFHLQSRNLRAEKFLISKHENKPISARMLQACLKMAFYSSKTYGLFHSYFDQELYFNENPRVNDGFHYCTVLGIVKVLADVEISNHNQPLYRDVQTLLYRDFVTIHDNSDSQILLKFSRYLTATVMVRLNKKMNAEDIQILSVSDNRAAIFRPNWWQHLGICYAINSYVGKLEFVAKAAVEGKMQIRLSGPFGVDYTLLIVGEKIIFEKPTPTWSNKPYVHEMNVKAGEEILIQVEWLPHKSDS